MKAAIFLALISSSAIAADSPATKLRKQYEGCAWSSLMTTPRRGVEPNLAAETALAACQTEEQAIIVYLGQFSPPDQAAAALVTLKLRLKRELVKTARDLQ